MSKLKTMMKIENELNKLEVAYLLNHPKRMSRDEYLKKKGALRRRYLESI